MSSSTTSKKVVFISSVKPYDIQFFNDIHKRFFDEKYTLKYFEGRLNKDTVSLAKGADAVVAFVNDKIDAEVVEQFSQWGIKHIANRCAGYDHVDTQVAKEKGITISRVPSYSPYAVSEHALSLMLALNRHIPKAYNHVREGDFSLRGLIGFDMHGKTAGIVGTGKIGFNLCKILLAMGMRVVAHDIYQSEDAKKAGVEYVSLEELFKVSDIISLHANLTKETKHMINAESIAQMKEGVMIINTSRGGLLDTKAVIQGLKTKKIGSIGLDVYEYEQAIFFEDKSDEVIQDDTLMRLTSFNNVIITSHQAYFTKEALENIAKETLTNLDDFFSGKPTKKENVVA